MRPSSVVRGAGPACCHLALMWSRSQPGGGFPLGHVDNEISQRDMWIRPRCFTSYGDGECVECGGMCVSESVWMRWTGSAVGCCSSVAMDHLNSLCCIHVGWEQSCVQVPSDKFTPGLWALLNDQRRHKHQSEMWRSGGVRWNQKTKIEHFKGTYNRRPHVSLA